MPDGAEVIDATGRWVLPGFIDAHTHLGGDEEAEGWAGQDTNESTDPVTAQVRALDTINPARVLGIEDRLGSLAPGKDADFCVWSGDPLDVMSRVERAFVRGDQVYSYDPELRAGVLRDPGFGWTLPGQTR